MNNIMNVRNEAKTMNTREIADLTGTLHKNVIAKCRKMLVILELQPAEFSARYIDDKGESRDCFELNQELTMTLVSGYDARLRNAVVKRWMALESGKAAPIAVHTDPIIAMRYEQLAIKDRLDVLENKVEIKLIEASEPKKRELTNYKPDGGFAFSKDCLKIVSQSVGCTRALVSEVIRQHAGISSRKCKVEYFCDYEVCFNMHTTYNIADLMKQVQVAIDTSNWKTAKFRVFPTLGFKKMKHSL